MSINPLNDISKVYLEQVSESAVPGKPAEKLGAVTAIPKSEQEAARERILAKTKAKREKMEEERNDEPGEGPRQKYGDMRGLDRSGAPTSFGGKWQSKERKEAGAAALAKLNKEALDPVGQEDADIDNDDDTDKSDKYLHNRRKAIGKAIAKKRGKGIKEGFSNWRQDLSEVMGDIEDNKQIKEKKVNNKIKINPKLGEAIEEIGGTLIEMVEIDEKMNLATADMGEVIKDFQTSDAPQFKGKTKEERRKMALAAKLEAERHANEELQPTTPQQFAAQRQLTMAQRKLTAADQAALKMKKKEVQQQEEFVSEEDYDRMKDERMMRGGVDGNTNYRKPVKSGSSKPVDPEQRKKVAQKALELVRQQTMSKYGKKSLM